MGLVVECKYLSRFPPNLFVRLSLFRFLGSLLRSLLRHVSLQLGQFLLLLFLRERFDLQDGPENVTE